LPNEEGIYAISISAELKAVILARCDAIALKRGAISIAPFILLIQPYQ
jgi:hypothetical protein